MWKLKGYTVDAFDQTQVVYNIWANTKNDLPSTMTDIGYGTALGFGSTAQTFDDSKEWRWNGTEWVEQTDGQQIEISADDIVYDNTSSGMTSTNVQDAIDELHTTDDTQDRALAELYGEDANQQLEINYAINTGAKNMLYISNTPGYTATSHGRTFTVLSDGGIKITGASSDNSNADFYVIGSWSNRSILLNENQDSCLIRLTCDTDYGYNQIRLRAMNRSTGSTVNETGVETNKDVKLSHVITTVFVSVFPSVTLPEDGIVVYPMIRNSVIRNSTYEPYAPTNRELYETKVGKEDLEFTDKWGYVRPTIGGTGDFNTIVSSGYYRYNGAPANAPTGATGEFGILMVFAAGSYISQIVHCFLSSQFGIYIRHSTSTGSSWTAWTKLGTAQVASTQSLNSPMTLNLDRNDLNESLDTNFDLIDSIPEEEEGEQDV